MARSAVVPVAGKASVSVLRQGPIHNSGIPLGGLGTGGVEIWPDGRLYQWMLPNGRPWSNNGHVMKAGPADAPQPAAGDADFLVRVAIKGQRPMYRWLFAGNGLAITTASHFWRHHKYFFIKSFQEVQYRAEYPFAELTFIDPEFPVDIRLKAWSAFVPHNVKDSSLPGCCFDVEVMNRSQSAVEVSVLWQMQNVAGFACAKNAQEHTLLHKGELTAITMAGGLDEPGHWSSGDMTIWAQQHTGQSVDAIACNPYFQNLIWSLHRTGHMHGPLLPEFIKHEEHVRQPSASVPNKGYICVRQRLAAGKAAQASFGMSWYFPHHIIEKAPELGHRYQEWFASSLEVAKYMAAQRKRLQEESAVLPREVMASTLPGELKVAVLDQTATLIKNSHFIRDGRFGVQEGHGCCAFNTVDVDHYASYALSLLQPELRRTINDMHQGMAHPANGKIHHGLGDSVHVQPNGGGAKEGYSRWDVCCQYALAVWRDCAWSGDRETLKRHWPTVWKAVNLVASMDFYGIGLPYIQGGITYDHWNMQGVVGYMAGVYLASLRAVEEMAKVLGDEPAALWAHDSYQRGRKGFETKLWNGSQYVLYYGRRPKDWKPGDDDKGEHQIFDPVKPPESCCGSPCACDDECDCREDECDCDGDNVSGDCCCQRPQAYIQIADTGLMTDLLNGEGTASVMGLGTMLDRKRVRGYLKRVYEGNLQPENRCLTNGSYPDEHFLDQWPFMQWQTPWTGTEYFYSLMCYAAGMVKEGDTVVRMVHERHVRDGMRFDHAECNNHYARPLCIWGAWAARIGLRLNALAGVVGMATADGKPYAGLLLTGTMVGHCEYQPGKRLAISAIQGRQKIASIEIGQAKLVKKATVMLGKKSLANDVIVRDGIAMIELSRPIVLGAGQSIEAKLA